ncbi:phosphatase PAP2 family protein [Rhodococcus kronopolitis]|uniref:Phosphatase PAP2 family protein n=1 Tax=Rhodococcus kronopolitis TaxID=1460226 RepID=A0ABV9FQB6_9NOCA
MQHQLSGPPRHWSYAVLALLIALLAVVTFGPWQMASNPLMRASTWLYTQIDLATSGWSSGAGTLVDLVTEGLLVLLAGLLALTVWLARGNVRAVAVGLSGGAGVVGAIAATLFVKAMFAEPRPCEAVPDLHALSECPPMGDWSFPSNHSGISAALAAAVVLTALAAGTRRTWLPVVAVASAVVTAALRVVSGVHYPHDVVAGLLFGSSVAVAVTIAATPVAVAVLTRLGMGGLVEADDVVTAPVPLVRQP